MHHHMFVGVENTTKKYYTHLTMRMLIQNNFLPNMSLRLKSSSFGVTYAIVKWKKLLTYGISSHLEMTTVKS